MNQKDRSFRGNTIRDVSLYVLTPHAYWNVIIPNILLMDQNFVLYVSNRPVEQIQLLCVIEVLIDQQCSHP